MGFPKLLYIIATQLSLMPFNSAQSQQVDKKGKLEGKHYFRIDTGSEGGFTTSRTACVYGKKNEKIACGKIARSLPDKCIVHLPRPKLRKIKKGMQVRLFDFTCDEMLEKFDFESSNEEISPYHLNAFYLISVIPSIRFNYLRYAPPSEGARSARSLWSTEFDASYQIIGAGITYHLQAFNHMKSRIGAKFENYDNFENSGDYSRSTILQYTEISMEAFNSSFWYEYLLYSYSFSPSISISTPIGIELEYASVSFEANRKSENINDEDFSIAKGNISTFLFSLKMSGELLYQIPQSQMSFLAGLNLTIPILPFGEQFSNSTQDPNANLLTDKTFDQDLKNSLRLEKNALGLELAFGAKIQF